MDWSLAAVRDKGAPVPPRILPLILVQVLDGFAVLHLANICHRDVKCGNILVNTQGLCVMSWELLCLKHSTNLNRLMSIHVNHLILCKFMLIYVNLCRNISPDGAHGVHMGFMGMGPMGVHVPDGSHGPYGPMGPMCMGPWEP